MATYINYELNDGEFVKIPKEEIDRIMKLPDVKTEDDACWIWCEDNGKVINEEQEELDKKAKASRITATIHQAKAEAPREKRKVERKADQTKDGLVNDLAEYLKDIVDNVTITKVGKLIEFDIKDEHFKLDLIRQRKPKVKG